MLELLAKELRHMGWSELEIADFMARMLASDRTASKAIVC